MRRFVDLVDNQLEDKKLGAERPEVWLTCGTERGEAATDKLQSWRKAPFRKLCQPISGSKFLRGLSEGRHEPAVGVVHRPAKGPAEGVR